MSTNLSLSFKIFILFYLVLIHSFIFGCAGSLLLLGFFSSCGEWGLLLVAAPEPLLAVSSLALEHRLNSCGSWAWLLCSVWDLPRLRIEPVSLALAGGFFTTEWPGKPLIAFFFFFLMKTLTVRGRCSHLTSGLPIPFTSISLSLALTWHPAYDTQ